MVGWHHRCNRQELVVDGQEGLACCGPWGGKELDKNNSVLENIKLSLDKLMELLKVLA